MRFSCALSVTSATRAHFPAGPSPGVSIQSVDPEALRNVAQRPRLAIVGWFRSRIADDHRAVALVGDPKAPRAPEAPLNIDLTATRTHEIPLAVLVKLDDSHAAPAFS
jgi:hypothetical protein